MKKLEYWIAIILSIVLPFIIYFFNKTLSASNIELIDTKVLIEYYKVTLPLIFGIYKYAQLKKDEKMNKYSSLTPKISIELIGQKKNKFKLTIRNNDRVNSLREIQINGTMICNSLSEKEKDSISISFSPSKAKNIKVLDGTNFRFDKDGYPKELGITSVDIEDNMWLSEFNLIDNGDNKSYINYKNEMV